MPIRRRDFSKHLVHLTRDLPENPARENLLSILVSCTIEARSALGMAIKRLERFGCDTDEALASQAVCCFSETPLEDLGGLIDPGVWRRYGFQPYGVVFERALLLREGANPVWYLNSYSGSGISFPWLAHDVNALMDAVIASRNATSDAKAAAFCESPISRLTPMIETMGSWPTASGRRKEKDFSFEREWRHAGDFRFRWTDVVAIITPPEDQDAIRLELEERVPGRFTTAQWKSLKPSDVLDG